MPITNGKYVNPGWKNGGPPALDAGELNAISDRLQYLDANAQVTKPTPQRVHGSIEAVEWTPSDGRKWKNIGYLPGNEASDVWGTLGGEFYAKSGIIPSTATIEIGFSHAQGYGPDTTSVTKFFISSFSGYQSSVSSFVLGPLPAKATTPSESLYFEISSMARGLAGSIKTLVLTVVSKKVSGNTSQVALNQYGICGEFESLAYLWARPSNALTSGTLRFQGGRVDLFPTAT